jgi:hypothetical protein
VLAAAQARLAVALIEKVATGAAVRWRSRCTPRTVAPPPPYRPQAAAALSIVGLGADLAMQRAIGRALRFTPEQTVAGLAALADVRGILATAGDTFQSASRIVFAPSRAPNRIIRAGL